MKVCSINNVYFKGIKNDVQNSSENHIYPQVNEIKNVAPDFQVKTPQKFTKLRTETLDNGLEVHKYKLNNGYKVTIVPMEDSPAVVKTYVNVGSMNETQDIKGISHFLEHMAFNGTNGENGHIKLETGDSFKKIDALGGWTNASTNYAITDYVNSTPLLENNDIETQIKVLASMTEDLKLSDAMIKKEKGPVCSEINMIMDDTMTVALDQTVRTLFNVKSSADELVGGSTAHIQNLTRKDVLDYYNKYYTPDNTNIVVTGNVNPDEVIQLISKNFTSSKFSRGNRFETKLTPIQHTVRKDFVSDKTKSAQIVLGFAGPQNNNAKEQALFDLVTEYLYSYESGLEKNLKQYNTNQFCDSEKISTNPKDNRFIYMGISVSDKNCENVLKTVFETIRKRKPVNQELLSRLKENRLKNREEALEYSVNVNTMLGNAELNGNTDSVTKYSQLINSITADELNQAIDKYFDLNKTAITVIHPSKTEVNFKGKNRQPLNTDKVSEYTLPNNYRTAFYNTKSGNINYISEYTVKEPYTKKAGTARVLNEIFRMGNSDMTEDEFNEFQSKNKISLFVQCSNNGLCAVSDSTKNYRLGIDTLQDLINNPRITEENLAIAKQRIKDRMSRREPSAFNLYNEYDAKNIPGVFTAKEIMKSLDSVTLEDVKELHSYLLDNSSVNVKANIPENNPEVKDFILESLNKQKVAQPVDFTKKDLYKTLDETVILTKANKNSQADIKEVFHFKSDDSIKEAVSITLLNSILTSSSIGLFDILREKEHLAYAVHSNIDRDENRGSVHLNILTTTDNKDIGEVKYENVQKSIDGFNRQINELIKGSFTEEDLNSAKKSLKSELLDNEGTLAKLHSMKMNSKYGIDADNKIFKEIDNITKDDIINLAQTVFAGKPVISIVATQDTLDANKEYLNTLKNN